MSRTTTRLRALLERGTLITLPSAYDALTARMVQDAGFDAVYNGGFVTGGSTCISEPLLTMRDQVEVGQRLAAAVQIPLVMDAGAGFGDPVHVMRTVRECIRSGIAGVHIEDQVFPKRAHYHADVTRNIPLVEYRDKIRFACEQRDESDMDFVIIARSDACRIQGYEEAIRRVNVGVAQGADMTMIFPRNHEEAVSAPKDVDAPMVYVQSRGNRDGRPLYTPSQLQDMGYAMVIDAVLSICVNFHFTRLVLQELKHTGDYRGLTQTEWIAARQGVEDIIGLEDYYRIERDTVERAAGEDEAAPARADGA